MPVYTFFDTKTGEEYDSTMTCSELDTFLEENPHIERVFKMNIVDPINVGVQRPPADFSKYVLGKVAQMPGAKKEKFEKRWAIKKEI